jgi:hypothetical protein
MMILISSTGMHARAADLFSDTGNTGKVVDAFIGVLGMAGPEAAVALVAAQQMKGIMEMLGFFSKPDPFAKINERLDAIEKRLDGIDQRINNLQNGQFKDRNQRNADALRAIGQKIELIVQGVKDKPPDAFNKNRLQTEAKQICDDFIAKNYLWMWSDLCVGLEPETPGGQRRPVAWHGKTYSPGNLMDADFKLTPTLEIYATALGTWLLAVEYAYDNNKTAIKQDARLMAELQKHIDFMSVRQSVKDAQTGRDRPWDETKDAAQSFPELLRVKIQTEYFPAQRYPDPKTLQYTILEYTEDDFARERKVTGAITATATSSNEMCGVPTGMWGRKSTAEETLEQGYGGDVMDMLRDKLKYFQRQGTLREQYIGTFVPITSQFETLYFTKPDGTLWWQVDNFTIKNGYQPPQKESEYIYVNGKLEKRKPIKATGKARFVIRGDLEILTHGLSAPKQVGSGWENVQEILPGGGSTVYALLKNGDLNWYFHNGSLKGDATWQGPTRVGTGWGGVRLVPNGDGLIYTIAPDGTMKMYTHKNYKNGQGLYAGWAPEKVVMSGMNRYKQVFGGGNGVIYAVDQNNDLYWFRHDYKNAVDMPKVGLPSMVTAALTAAWAKTWDGPNKIGIGWNVPKLFCSGSGHIYAVTSAGEMTAYDHCGWREGSANWGTQSKIGENEWGEYPFIFARMPDSGGVDNNPQGEDTIHVH